MEPTNPQPGQVINPTPPTPAQAFARAAENDVKQAEELFEKETHSALSVFWRDQLVVRAKRTFVQAFGMAFLAGFADLFRAYAHGGLAATEAGLLALAIGAGSAGVSAVWGLVEAYIKTQKSTN